MLEALDQRAAGDADRRRDVDGLAVLVDAKTLADMLGVSRDFVYRHADELGAIKVGGALRFDAKGAIPRSVSKGSQDANANDSKGSSRSRARRKGAGARWVPDRTPLLPVGGATDRRKREAADGSA